MPSVRPRTSWLPCADLSQTPSCIRWVFSGSRRASAMISPMTSSTTLRVLEYGALNTAMPALGGGSEVDLVGADAERADRQQVGSVLEDPLGHLGVGADADQVAALQRLDQVVLTEGVRPGVHDRTRCARRPRSRRGGCSRGGGLRACSPEPAYERSRSQISRIHDAVGVALLGEEALPVLGEVGVDGVAADDRVEAGGLAVRLRVAAAGRAAAPPPGGSRRSR